MTNTSPQNTYGANTAGRVMVQAVPTIEADVTIQAVEHLLVKRAREFETINYIYVLQKKKLVGVLSVKELFRQSKEKKVSDVMRRELITARVHSDQQHVVLLALKHAVKSIPVVDKNDHFLGVVPPDKILQLLDTKAVQNLLRFGGVMYSTSFDNITSISFCTSLKHRLPWLIIGLCGGMLMAGIVHGFEEVLSRNFILAAFIPLMIYMSDAVGTQMEAFIIRDLAINPTLQFFRYFLRQFFVVVAIGGISSLALYGISLFIYHNSTVSLILCEALFFAILSSLITGLLIPFAFSKLRMDPANASGPIATIVQNILSVLVYFSVVSWLL